MSVYSWVVLAPFIVFAVYLAWVACDGVREWLWSSPDLGERP